MKSIRRKNASSKSKSWPNPTSFISFNLFRELSLRIGKTVKTIAIVPIKIKHVKQPPFNQILYLSVTDFETRPYPHRATLGEVRVDSVKDCTSIKLAHTAWALKKNLLTCKKQGRF